MTDRIRLMTQKEHLVQWHSTVLTKLALIPQRTINSYARQTAKDGGKSELYREGDFVVTMKGCDVDETRDCEAEMLPYWRDWVKALKRV